MRTIVAGPSQVGKTHLSQELALEQNAWFLNLDPARQDPLPLGCAALHRPDGAAFGFRFIGALSLARDPIATLAAVSWATKNTSDEPLICELPIENPSPVSVHLLRTIIDVLAPDKLIAIGYPAAGETLQPPERCELETREPSSAASRRPPRASAAWRKAVWKSLFDKQPTETIPLSNIRIAGARLGSGIALETEEMAALHSIGIRNALRAEVSHGVLTIVASGEPNEGAIHSAADYFGCETAHVVDPHAFDGLVCGFENKLGEHFALGRIQKVDFAEGAITLQSAAQPPWPLTRLHIGHLALDENCNELGHLKPWQV